MSLNELWDLLIGTLQTTGFIFVGWKVIVMWLIGLFFLYMAIAKDFEPNLLLPIGFGFFWSTSPTPHSLGLPKAIRNFSSSFISTGSFGR